MNRRTARDLAFKLVYELSVQKDKLPEELIADTAVAQEFVPDVYLRSVVNGVYEKAGELDALIEECAVGWKLERLAGVSLAIMRLATYEMLYADDVPFSVAINEAVELAKKYDHDKSPKFINGILNKIAEKCGLKQKKSVKSDKSENSEDGERE